ncbi:MAG: helix-hairpin-helix domain-containing protein [Betaproteobacteria bacterium]|nr:helix-hairpin-helix domain-containing protein [Betaproteobacteria bacterium]NCW00641.1 helix-hairpin-helix domain-containing protein [Betaproteobacteria bacterium]NDA05652.1 helix-hairpin-helix domain-containing protein [Betaproteobacteria bacterium]NDA31697.1 helix-hairpin-helix domain-containing protein [Betaproteobacteria bacterium]NDG60066.1 helix-hairpin-helix domain-containing protein [Betaproteobacteria bacterium]
MSPKSALILHAERTMIDRLNINRFVAFLFTYLALGLACCLANASTPIDANTASVEQLQSIAGIGPATAQRIIQTRQRKPFKDLRDFAERVPGVGPKRLQQYSDAGLVVKRVAPLASASPTSSQRQASEANSNKPPEQTDQASAPLIGLIEGGLRDSAGKKASK